MATPNKYWSKAAKSAAPAKAKEHSKSGPKIARDLPHVKVLPSKRVSVQYQLASRSRPDVAIGKMRVMLVDLNRPDYQACKSLDDVKWLFVSIWERDNKREVKVRNTECDGGFVTTFEGEAVHNTVKVGPILPLKSYNDLDAVSLEDFFEKRGRTAKLVPALPKLKEPEPQTTMADAFKTVPYYKGREGD